MSVFDFAKYVYTETCKVDNTWDVRVLVADQATDNFRSSGADTIVSIVPIDGTYGESELVHEAFQIGLLTVRAYFVIQVTNPSAEGPELLDELKETTDKLSNHLVGRLYNKSPITLTTSGLDDFDNSMVVWYHEYNVDTSRN